MGHRVSSQEAALRQAQGLAAANVVGFGSSTDRHTGRGEAEIRYPEMIVFF